MEGSGRSWQWAGGVEGNVLESGRTGMSPGSASLLVVLVMSWPWSCALEHTVGLSEPQFLFNAKRR